MAEPAVPAPAPVPHVYLSTGCLHGDHDYCQTEARRYDGTTKIAGTCKFCGEPCVCPCHHCTAA